MAPEPEESPELRELFANYSRPTANAAFDARFWRELDARQNRYRGLVGMTRRLIEIEIEGIAVWRLGFSLFGGAAVCGLGVALLSLGVAPQNSTPPQIARNETVPTMMPRYAREMWDESAWEIVPRALPRPQPRQPQGKEKVSCVSSAQGLV